MTELEAAFLDPRWMMLLLVLIVVDAVLRGMALWRAGRNSQLAWFIALFIINSVGILPLIYLLGFSKPKVVASS